MVTVHGLRQPLKNLRNSGIPLIGDVPWGTHFCQFYQTKEDLIETLIPYVKNGLESNEFCMWVTADNLNKCEAEQALRAAIPSYDSYVERGAIEVLPYTEWYLDGAEFDRHKVLNSWVEKLNQALDMGFVGARVTGDTMWLEKSHWQDFKEYEQSINTVIGDHPLLVLCTYSLDKCGASEIADVVANHEFAIMKRYGEWNVIESSPVKQAKQALQAALGKLEQVNEELTAANEELEVTNAELRAVEDQLRSEIEQRKRAEEELRRQNEIKEDLLKREHRIAEILQQAIIPVQIPTCVSGCRFVSKYVPALTEAQVGGDFYDVFDLGDGRVGVLIGDIAGKGVYAAMRVSAARYAFRSYAYIEPDPSRVVSLVNDALCKDNDRVSGMLTAFYAVVDTNNRTVSYTNGGHEPPVIRRRCGSVAELNDGARVLGVLPGCEYPQGNLRLESGDVLVLITDGITEARSAEYGMFGKDAMLQFIAEQNGSPSEIVDRLLDKAKEYGNGQLQDDVAIVALGLE